jgi:hypothetical protein
MIGKFLRTLIGVSEPSKVTYAFLGQERLHVLDGVVVCRDVFSQVGVIQRSEFLKAGMLHREDGPAVVYHNNSKVKEEWYLYNIRHREGGPAVIPWNVGSYEWWVNGLLHREDGPAVVSLTGEVTTWYLKGKMHRIGGPAHVQQHRDTGKVHEIWCRNGVQHRDGGPAVTLPRGDYEYWVNGKKHRSQWEGPAIFKKDGNKEFWENGRLLRVE